MNTNNRKIELRPGFISAAPNAKALPDVFNPPRAKQVQGKEAYLESARQRRLLNEAMQTPATQVIPKKINKFFVAVGFLIIFGPIYCLVKHGSFIPPFLFNLN